MTINQYKARLAHLDRAALLKLCRAGGLSAQRCKTNDEILRVLWVHFGKATKA